MGADVRKFNELDRLIHEPARLMIVTVLAATESADFLYLERETGLTRGNLSAHLGKLQEAGYIKIEKTYKGRLPLTICKLTADGRRAFSTYRRQLQEIVRTTSP
ncbi:MAG: winged helix-turn-helix domain-containing protein [Anaerolineae bacterium]